MFKIFKEKIVDNPRPDSPEDGEIVHTYGWDWCYIGGTYTSHGDVEHPGPFTLRYQGTRIERTQGNFLLRGWWFLAAPDRYSEEQVGLITGSATYTEACSFAWQRITGKSWPRTPTRTELLATAARDALDKIDYLLDLLPFNSHEYLNAEEVREVLAKALEEE